MFKWYLSLLLIAFLSTGCVQHHQQKIAQPVVHTCIATSQYKQVSTFNRVDVQGPININLHTGYKRPQIILKGDEHDLAQIQIVVTQNTLYLRTKPGYRPFGIIHADIRSQSLNSLHYVGTGTITGNRLNSNSLDLILVNPTSTRLSGNIRLRKLNVKGSGVVQINGISSPYLSVDLKGNSRVQLTGTANVGRIKLDGNAWLNLYWIKSNNLTIRGKKGAKIQLAGAVNVLDLELWGTTHFKGRFLRAQRSFVKTHGHSVAEISAVKHQSSLATDASDILYYNLPQTRADFMAFNGAVLDMRDWNNPEIKDFTLYNKQFP